jgi:DNA primase
MERDGVSFDHAVHQLCEDFGITINDSDEYRKQEEIVKRNTVWARAMQKKLPNIVEYLHNRGITDDSIKNFGLGYSEKLSALSIPMQDEWGRCVAFLYRFFDKSPKYKNSKNIDGLFVKGEFLFGLPQAQKFLKATKTLMLCEGALDAISAIQQGNCCVAYCGISVGKSHIEKIKDIVTPMKAKVVLCPDNDGKASKFVQRARDLFRKQAPNIVVKVAVIPDGFKDFNDLIVAGKEIATACTYESIDLYCVRQLIANEPDRDMQENAIIEFMKTVRNPMTRADIAEFLAKTWDRDITLVRELLNVQTDTAVEKMRDVVSIESAFMKLQNKHEEETFGTGFDNIDRTIQFTKKNVIVLGAYSFSGKTDMLTEWILHWCIVENKRVLFFSMEMPIEDIMKVIVAKIVEVPRHTVLKYIKEHPETYNFIIEKLRKNLFIVEKNSLTFDNMADYVRLMQNKETPVDIVAVDYFQYMKNVGTIEEQDATARQMKAFAKEMGVTLVMLSQLRKASQSKEANGNFHEPTQADLAGAGAIGNSADYIILIWRPALNASLSPIDREQQKYDTVLKITKAREVRSADTIFRLEYDPQTSRLHEKLEGE